MLELAPVEAPARLEQLAIGVSLFARGGAQRVGGLEREQRFIPMNRINPGQGFGERCLQLLGPQRHRQAVGFCAACV
jgi:hypothetical protein